MPACPLRAAIRTKRKADLVGSCGFPIRQQRDDSAPFQIADDARVSVIAPPGPIVNANHSKRVRWRTATAADHAQQRILTHWQRQPLCEACRRSSAERQTKVMYDRIPSRRASGRWSQHPVCKALSEDLVPAQYGIAMEAAGGHRRSAQRAADRSRVVDTGYGHV